MRLLKSKSIFLCNIIFLKFYFQLDEEDELSSMVCKKCIEQLIQWEFFYETCHRSENLLRQRLENGKTEIKEDHLNDTSCEPALSDDDFDSADLIPYLYVSCPKLQNINTN